MKLLCLFFLLLFAMSCFADNKLPVTKLTSQIKSTEELGKIHIEGIGEVKLSARKRGTQIVIHAQDASGKGIGKAETIIGLSETPVYVKSPKGLTKILILWGK